MGNAAGEDTSRGDRKAALEAERARMAAVLEHAPIGVMIAEAPSGRLVYTNAEMDRVVSGGGAKRQADLYAAWIAVHADGRTLSIDEYPLIRAVRDGDTVQDEKLRFRRFDGTYVDVRISAAPITDVDGTIVGGIATVTDTVRDHAAAEALVAAQAEAETASRAKSDLLATMSHALRTPLNAILGYAELIELGLAGPVTDTQRAYFQRVRASGHQLLTLIDDVLDVARAEAGQVTVERRPCDLREIARAVLARARSDADRRGVVLDDRATECPPCPALGDDGRVRQILANLLGNAVKFTEPGGVVAVDCGSSDTPPPGLRFSGSAPWRYVRVADTGVGIPPEDLPTIFEPFMQVDGARRRTGSRGLGLTLSRRLARLVGGEITVESTLGQGSAFTLWLAGA